MPATVPCVWKPTSKPGLMVDVSDPSLAQMLHQASHLAGRIQGLVHVAIRALDGDVHAIAVIRRTTPFCRPAAEEAAELSTLEYRLAAAARFLKNESTDLSDVAVDTEDPTT